MLIARGLFEENILSHSQVIGTKPVFITYDQADRCYTILWSFRSRFNIYDAIDYLIRMFDTMIVLLEYISLFLI